MSYKRGLSIVIGAGVAALVSVVATWPRFHPDNNPPAGGTGGPAAVAAASSNTSPVSPAESSGAGGEASAVTPAPSSFGETSAFVDSLVPLVPTQDALSWAHLDDAQRTALAPFAAQWDKFSDARKHKWLRIAARYQKMSPDAQKRLHDRMTEWVRMTPDQRSVARENFQVSRALPPQARQKAWKAYQQLPADQKAKLAASERKRRPTVISAPPTGKIKNRIDRPARVARPASSNWPGNVPPRSNVPQQLTPVAPSSTIPVPAPPPPPPWGRRWPESAISPATAVPAALPPVPSNATSSELYHGS